jgi:hypothetical protein
MLEGAPFINKVAVYGVASPFSLILNAIIAAVEAYGITIVLRNWLLLDTPDPTKSFLSTEVSVAKTIIALSSAYAGPVGPVKPFSPLGPVTPFSPLGPVTP